MDSYMLNTIDCVRYICQFRIIDILFVPSWESLFIYSQAKPFDIHNTDKRKEAKKLNSILYSIFKII